MFFPFKNIPVNLGVAAVGSGVVKTGEAVGSAAVSGVNAVGKFTKPFFFGGKFWFLTVSGSKLVVYKLFD